MAWTTPKTNWTTGELVTAQDMNAVGANLAVLKDPATALYVTSADAYAAIATFADIDSTNLSLEITTAGGDVLVHFCGVMKGKYSSIDIYLDIDVDGNRLGGDKGILAVWMPRQHQVVSFSRLIQNLSAGSHTFKLQWKNDGLNGTYLIAGAQFWVREI